MNTSRFNIVTGIILLAIGWQIHTEAHDLAIDSLGPRLGDELTEGHADRYFPSKSYVESSKEPRNKRLFDHAVVFDRCAVGVGGVGAVVILVGIFGTGRRTQTVLQTPKEQT